jgi:uncharacterized protein YjbI with pentapeptide repeats
VPDIRKLALIIGVDAYYDKISDGRLSLPPLLSCKKDAEDLYALFSSDSFNYTIFGKYPIIGSKLDPQWGFTHINESINNFFLDAEPGQTLLFYFSGHGIPWSDDVFLATPQVNPKRPTIAGISLSNLTKIIQSSKSMRIICIIDACYSGAANLPGSRMMEKAAAENDSDAALATYDKILNIPKTEGKCLLLSSQAYEKSRAIENSNSLYTKYLIEGLVGCKSYLDNKGREIPASIDDNGNVTPQTLHEYVYYKVATETNQTPKLKSDQSSKLVIVTHPELASTASTINSNATNILANMEDLLLDSKVQEFNNMREQNHRIRLDFHAINLSYTNLSGANLSDSDLGKADLSGANLIGAKLVGANLRRATLHHANLSDSDLSKADLSGANLIGAKIVGATLYSTMLNQANLVRAELCNANVIEADFANANLQFADLEGVKNLYDSNLRGSDLRNAIDLPISKGEARAKGAIVKRF